MAKSVRRLIEQFVPENYALEINLVPENKSFSGTVTISGKKVGRPSQRITLHQKGLSITSATITRRDRKETKELSVDRINTHKSLDEVRLHSSEMVYPGNYDVMVEFSGKITDTMTGLYPCYFDHNGKKKFLLATQFESHHAREVFPCIDEPSAKATFDLSLTTPKLDTVLSNMPIKSEKSLDNEQKLTTFETSPVMSSYLLAFVTGEMHCVEAQTKRGITMRSWATLAQPKRSLKYANAQAVRIIDFFEDYFDTPFPLSKCDQVALPDLESGAMENWGLITYREVALLTDPDNRSLTSEQYVSMVVGHEVSHQWFGNLVTMAWWDDLWLNESFASLMEHIALDYLHPEWHQWEQYVSTDALVCSNRDVYKDVQPVRVEVNHPDEIHTLFDPAIVYAKGGRLLKMLLDYIGEAAFKKGLKRYFDVHAYKNTTRDDLWTALSESSDKDVNSFMNPWLQQSGMPVVDVVNGQDQSLDLSQSRFILDAKDDTSLWPVPLLSDEPTTPDVLTGSTEKVLFDGKIPPLLNVHGSGHYVVNYMGQAQKRIGIALKEQSIASEARINTLNDLILLNKRGDHGLTELIDIVKQCKNEPRDAVWALMSRILGLAAQVGEKDSSIEQGIKDLRRELSRDWHKKLGWDDGVNDDPNTKLLRLTMIGLMLGAEDKATIKSALNKYDSTTGVEELPSELRGLILGAVVRHRGTKKDIDALIGLYRSSNDPNIQHSVCGALTHTRDKAVAKRLLLEALGEEGFVRPQDIFRWYAYLMRNKHTRGQAWNWLTSSWNRLDKVFGGGKSFDHFIVYSAGPLHTKEWEDKFSKFFEPKKKEIALKRNIDIAQSEIATRIAWHDRNYEALKNYFA